MTIYIYIDAISGVKITRMFLAKVLGISVRWSNLRWPPFCKSIEVQNVLLVQPVHGRFFRSSAIHSNDGHVYICDNFNIVHSTEFETSCDGSKFLDLYNCEINTGHSL